VEKRINLIKISRIIGLCTVPFVMVLVVRSLGWLQPFEWMAYDWFFQLRPLEPIDERIVIVGMDESDIRKYGYPISDRNLARVLSKIKANNPKVIGLDIVRDHPVKEGIEELNEVFATTPNLIGVEKVVGEKNDTISPPPELAKRQRIASVDVAVDSDGVLRRGFFAITRTKDGVRFNSLGTHLAVLYLQEQGINSSPTPDGAGTQIGNVSLYPLQKNDGGYQNLDVWDFQCLINFRNPIQSFKKVSFSQVLEGKIEANLSKDKIVLLGMTAVSIKDEFYLPFSHSFNNPPKIIHGVEVQANLASELLGAVLDSRPTIKVIPDAVEYVFILIWGLGTAVAAWKVRRIRNYLILFSIVFGIIAILICVLFFGSFLAFLQGWWLPFVPSFFLISGTSILLSGLILWEKNQELKRLQEQLAFEKTQSALAKVARFAGHELKMPLQFIKFATVLSLAHLEELGKEIEKQSEKLPLESIEQIENLLEQLKEYCRRNLRNFERLINIVEELSLNNRPEDSQLTRIDINSLVDSIFKDITDTKQSQNRNFCLNLERVYDSAIGEKKIVIKDLNKVASNLISNACDAVLARSQKEVEFSAKIVVVTKAINHRKIELIVADNGEGISPKIANSIYLPFETSKRTRGGVGLGLHIVYEVLKNNRGQIRWERKDGMTRFIVTYPVQPM
jgi:CHASE2 domain-containing sensor protein/nitrogen-specific signal transduction histidine kinase